MSQSDSSSQHSVSDEKGVMPENGELDDIQLEKVSAGTSSQIRGPSPMQENKRIY